MQIKVAGESVKQQPGVTGTVVEKVTESVTFAGDGRTALIVSGDPCRPRLCLPSCCALISEPCGRLKE